MMIFESLNNLSRSITDQAFADFILPLPSSSSNKSSDIDETAWTDRLLFTTGLLDDQARNSLLSQSGIKSAWVLALASSSHGN